MTITKYALEPFKQSNTCPIEVAIPARASAKSKVAMLTVIVAALLLANCAKQDPLAGLSELPHKSGAALQPVLNSSLLATKIEQTALAPASQIPPQPPCAADASITFFDAKITTPITVCLDPVLTSALENNVFSSGPDTTPFKLTDLTNLENLKNGTLAQRFLCRTSNGPWAARLTSERGCIGTCSPVNQLIVIGVPNNIQFVWYGSFSDHPPGFEFVGSPIKTDDSDMGPCHNVPPVVVSQPLRP